MSDLIYPLAYGCKNTDGDVRERSRSGGVFTAVSDIIIGDGGVVYGCVLDESFRAVHMRATTPEERDRMRESKYVQSDMKSTLREVKKDLEAGLRVLFSGTPCQVDALKKYLEISAVNTEKLLTLDIVCHGVPSPKLWRDYLSYQERANGKIKSAQFRNKKDYGWKDHVETLITEGGRVDSKIYTTLFYTNYPLRRSCHECRYASKNRVSDITLADFWGIDELDGSFNDNRGVSLILVNSEKGKRYFDGAVNGGALEIREYDTESVNQKSLREPYYYNVKKEEFWKDYRENGFEFLIKKYTEKPTAVKLIEKIAEKIL